MKISIITVVYNNRRFITDCLQSVSNQTYPNIEHIVVDGGSTDGTLEAIGPYRHGLGALVSERDRGLYDALNKGIALATGDVVGVLHSDDVLYEPDTLAKVAAEFSRSKADLLYANGMYVPQDDANTIKRIYKGKPLFKHDMYFGWIPLHTTIYVRRELFDRYGLYDDRFRIASDYDISLRWFKNPAISKHFFDEWVVKMRLGGKSTTASLQKRKSGEDLQIIQRHGLPGVFTLLCKVGRKIPQYLIPRLINMRDERA